MRSHTALCIVILAAGSLPLAAEERRQHASHEHGFGKLDIALEGDSLHIELDSPAVNIIGFEHAPGTAEEHETLEKALARLEQGETLFVISGDAGCRLSEADVETSLTENGGHADEHSDEHHDKHHGEHHDDSAHADITASWHFTCSSPGAMDLLEVKLFEAFPGTERLLVQFISQDKQSGSELNTSRPIVKF